MTDFGFQPGQSPSDRRASFDSARRRRADFDNLQAQIAGLASTITGLTTQVNAQKPVLLEQAPGPGGVTAGTTPLTWAQVTVPAQAVNGRVLVIGHVLASLSTAADGFEVFLANSGAPTSQLANYRISHVGGIGSWMCSPHMEDTSLPAGVARTYLLRAVRTAGTGTATAFADPRFCRITALWVPA